MNKNSGRQYTKTSFRNGSRRAGTGISEADYSEESGHSSNSYDTWYRYERVRFPNDGQKPEDLNGPCIVIQEGRKN